MINNFRKTSRTIIISIAQTHYLFVLKILQYLRDEAHRFGLKHHRNRRVREGFNSELVDIKGIGKDTVNKLLSHFKSVSEIKNSAEEEIAKVVGASKAQLIKKYYSTLKN